LRHSASPNYLASIEATLTELKQAILQWRLRMQRPGVCRKPAQILIWVALAASAAGCSLTLPVSAQLEGSDETFSGTATGYMDGAGDLSLKSDKGRTCVGDFVYVTRRQGEGTFRCSDRSTGPFTFASTGNRGTGSGTLDGKRITFSFGQ
jgi:hypothetical protein